MNIFQHFVFFKVDLINVQYSVWDTLGMMQFTEDLIKWKRINLAESAEQFGIGLFILL